MSGIVEPRVVVPLQTGQPSNERAGARAIEHLARQRSVHELDLGKGEPVADDDPP